MQKNATLVRDAGLTNCSILSSFMQILCQDVFFLTSVQFVIVIKKYICTTCEMISLFLSYFGIHGRSNKRLEKDNFGQEASLFRTPENTIWHHHKMKHIYN